MRGKYTMIIKAKDGKVLRKWEVPGAGLPNKYFWEREKAMELSKFLRTADLTEKDVIVSEIVPTF